MEVHGLSSVARDEDRDEGMMEGVSIHPYP